MTSGQHLGINKKRFAKRVNFSNSLRTDLYLGGKVKFISLRTATSGLNVNLGGSECEGVKRETRGM